MKLGGPQPTPGQGGANRTSVVTCGHSVLSDRRYVAVDEVHPGLPADSGQHRVVRISVEAVPLHLRTLNISGQQAHSPWKDPEARPIWGFLTALVEQL